MRKYGLFVGGMAILALVLSGSPAAAAEKTGFVDIREVLVSSTAGKKAAEDLKKAFEKEKAAIQEKETELKKIEDELKKQRSILKEEVFREKDIAFQKKVRDFQLLVKDFREEFQAKDQEFAQKMLPDIMKLIGAIGDKEKYGMIIDVSAIPVAYHAKENDLTKRVIEEFNRTYKPKK